MSQVASDSLQWIKNELDHTLLRARQALETHVERPDDAEALTQCLELLHQVQGTLRIVEVYGAAMLAEEMEAVVRGLQAGEIERGDTAFEVLMRAMLQLPDYLERVIGGRRDMPLALLSLLNDLRGVRGQPLLSESALFAYNLAGRTASVVGHAADAGKAVDIKSLAGKLRPKFQSALLGWYKSGDAAHLATLADTAEQLEQAATTPAVFELWWIVGGAIEGLREGGIEPEVSLKQLLGQVDRQIKRLMDQGEADVAEDPAKELVNNLLYYIGRAGSNGERIKAIKDSFKLGELLPDQGEVEEARAGMAGPNVNLMRTVSGALKEDIARIKDTLDIFVRMAKTDAGELAPLDELLKKVGDTLSVLNLGNLRATLETERARLKSVVDRKGVAPDENVLMDIASGIVSVETQLDEAMVGLISPEGTDKVAGIEVEQTEMREVQAAVIRESIINLARVKEAIVEFVNDPSHAASLKPLPRHIREIQASLRFLRMERVVSLLESLRQYIRVKLLASQGVPAQNELDRMADAIVSIEFYLETVQQGRGNPLSMLDNAEACVAALGFPVGQSYPDTDDDDLGTESSVGAGSATGVDTTVSLPGEAIVMSETPAAEEESITLEGPGPIADEPTQVMDASIVLSTQADAGAAPDTVPAPKPAAASTGPAVIQNEDVDPEIVEIFLEEAQEVMSTLRENFPRWRSNPSDSEALTTVRRAFHTLKGSGRMVGARLIGEFAWSIENMLNRVIDQTVSASDEMFALIEHSIAAFPELIEQLEVGTPPKVDVQPLMDTATAFSRGEPAPGPDSAPAAAAPPPAAPVHKPMRDEPTMVSPAGLHAGNDEPTVIAPRVEVLAPASGTMDPVLYDIFNREAEGHLAVIQDFVRVAAAGRMEITEDLVRALHTLHGSAAMAGASGIVALLEPLDRYVSDLHAQKQPVPDADAALLGEAHDAALTLLAQLGGTGPVPPPDAALLGRLRALKAPATPGETVENLEAEDIVMAGPAQPAPPAAKPAADVPRDKPLKYVQLSELKDFDPELAAIFFEEATELLESTDNTMHQWTQQKNDPALVTQLQRNLHTIKGGARMAGLVPMGDLSHEMETVLTDIVDGRVAISTELFALLNRSVDRLHRMLEQSYANQPIMDGGDLVTDLRRVHGHNVDEELEPESHEERFESVRAPPPPPPIIEYGEEPPAPAAAAEDEAAAAEAALGGESERRAGSRIQYELIRVRADLLESALNYAGEMGIYRSRLEQQVTTINFNLTELDQTVVRLRDQLRKLEIETEAQIRSQYVQQEGEDVNPDFDPLELDQFSTLQQLSRALAESVGDLVSIQSLLLNQAREAETLLLQQSRVTTELQDGLMRTRMVPFSRHAQRLRRVVRQTADESGKRVELRLIGAEGEMDRQVLERVLAPLEHMLRNSVVHGIETTAQRKQQGKPETGTITIALHREGSEVVMEVSDDGAGLNLAAIRKKAEQTGLTRPDARLSDRDIMSFILEAGFSTAEQVTQSAGRGVGMDVVASEIKQLGGSLRIDSQAGKGAHFTVRLPFTLAITQALLVNMAEQVYAIPLPSIEGIARIPRTELERLMAGDNPVYMYGGRPYYLQHLSVLLGIGAPEFPEELSAVPLLLVRSGDSSIAVITEGMQGSREVVVKSVGPQVSSIRGISGATILGDGSILLILDVTALARGMAREEEAPVEVVEREAPQEDTRTVAMVVDDSITVRRVTQRLLERYNMKVITAKDGVDALATLQENIPDVMLLDIEMPRMDGYELAQHMRNDERFRNIPIIMITSRTGEKHRNRAMEIGVNKYLGKPYQESELLENIQELVGSFSPQRTRWD